MNAKPAGIRKTTLAELGPNLPLGIVDPYNKIERSLSAKRWRLREERELGALRDQNRTANVAQYTGIVLATMYERIGALDFTDPKMKFAEKRVLISSLWMGDAFYAYVWLRRQALGNELKIKLSCAMCSEKFDFPADLDSLEVKTADSLEDALSEYPLRDPIVIRGQTVEAVTLGPARWSSIEVRGVAGSLDTGAAKSALLRGSIHKIRGFAEQIVLTTEELDELSKRDVEGMTAVIDEKGIGPTMAVEGRCPHCRSEFSRAIDWGFDGFFGGSSP